MKKLFLPLISLLLFCLCGCPMEYVPSDNFIVHQFKKIYKANEDIVFSAQIGVYAEDAPWIITFEGLPKDVDIEKGEKCERSSTEKSLCISMHKQEDEDDFDDVFDVEASVRFSFDTPGEYTIKVNAFQDNGQEVAEKYYPQESFTYTITVTE